MWNTGKAATRKDNAKHGQGNETLANGDRFEGEVKNGLMHGKGTYFFRQGGKNDGEWFKGKKKLETEL